MKKIDWVFAFRVVEIALGLCPAIFLLLAGTPYLFVLVLLPFTHPPDPGRSAAISLFARISAMVVGGILGLVSIGLLSNVAGIRNSRTRRVLAVVFGCAGLAAEIMFVLQDRIPGRGPNLATVWILTGPIVVGTHFAHRAFRQNRGKSQVS